MTVERVAAIERVEVVVGAKLPGLPVDCCHHLFKGG